MDRNSIIGFVLISVLLIFYFIHNKNQVDRQAERQRAVRDSIALVEQYRQDSLARLAPADTTQVPVAVTEPTENDSLRTLFLEQEYGPFAHALEGEETLYTIENERIKVVLSSLGGRIHTVELKNYKTFHGEPVVLQDGSRSSFTLGIPTSRRYLYTDSLYFAADGQSFAVEGADSNTITFVLQAGEGRTLRQHYSLKGESNFVDYSLEMEGFSDIFPTRESKFTIDWTNKLNLQERDFKNERQYTSIYYQTSEDEVVDNLSRTKDRRDEAVKVPLKWVAFKQQFFNSTLISEQPFSTGSFTTITPDNGDYVRDLRTKLYLDYTAQPIARYDMKFYFGQNGFYNLKRLGYGMQEMVGLGGFMLGQINRYLILPVFDFFGRFTGNYGIIILLLAIFIKIILTPLTYKSFVSSAKMRILKPEIEAIKEKNKDDMQKQQMETMKLYQKTGVNMMGGCIPLLLQMPILIAMYQFFPASIYLRQAEFLWATDLSTYDSIFSLPFTIPFYGDHVSLFTILMAATSVLYARMNSQLTPGAQAAQMKMLQYIMPFFLVFIFNSLPSGLTYYYLLYNVLSFGQQWFFMKYVIDEKKLRAKIEERRKKPVKKSRWAKRLEELQKLQEQKKGKK